MVREVAAGSGREGQGWANRHAVPAEGEVV